MSKYSFFSPSLKNSYCLKDYLKNSYCQPKFYDYYMKPGRLAQEAKIGDPYSTKLNNYFFSPFCVPIGKNGKFVGRPGYLNNLWHFFVFEKSTKKFLSFSLGSSTFMLKEVEDWREKNVDFSGEQDEDSLDDEYIFQRLQDHDVIIDSLWNFTILSSWLSETEVEFEFTKEILKNNPHFEEGSVSFNLKYEDMLKCLHMAQIIENSAFIDIDNTF